MTEIRNYQADRRIAESEMDESHSRSGAWHSSR